jgi:hypothetical protein
MQEEISKQQTILIGEIEEKKSIVNYGAKWVDHAKSRNACKVCSRPFGNPGERDTFIKRFTSVRYAIKTRLQLTRAFLRQLCCLSN